MGIKPEVGYKRLGDLADTNRAPSNAIWGNCPIHQIQVGAQSGLYFFDDFFQAGSAESSDIFAWAGGTPAMPYRCFADTDATAIKPAAVAADDEIGVLFANIDLDNEEAYVTFNAATSSPFGKISDTATDNLKLWFEARVRFQTVTSVSKMVGLRAMTDAGADDITAGGGSIKTEEFIGFRARDADGDGMDAIHMDTAEVVVQEAAATGRASNLVLVADTWHKFGIYFDGTNVHWYANGVKVSGGGVLPAATDFPDAETLMPYLGARIDTVVDGHFDIDWWGFAQLKL